MEVVEEIKAKLLLQLLAMATAMAAHGHGMDGSGETTASRP